MRCSNHTSNDNSSGCEAIYRVTGSVGHNQSVKQNTEHYNGPCLYQYKFDLLKPLVDLIHGAPLRIGEYPNQGYTELLGVSTNKSGTVAGSGITFIWGLR